MSARCLRVGILTLVVSTAVAITVATGPAVAAARLAGTGPGWRVVDALPSHGIVTSYMGGITATGPRDAWAFGLTVVNDPPPNTTPVLRHWNGRAWRSFPVSAALAAFWSRDTVIPAGSSSPRNVWAFTLSNWARWNGRRWTTGRLPGVGSSGAHITGTAVLSRRDVWVVGDLNDASITPYFAHFNGTRWRWSTLPTVSESMIGISASGPDNVWMAGNSGVNLLKRWDGHRWRNVPMPVALAKPTTFGGLVALSRTSVWITGLVPTATSGFTGGAWHWNGSGWKMYRLPAACELAGAAPDGHGGLWAFTAHCNGQAKMWHLSGGHWRSSPLPGGGPNSYVAQFSAVPGTSAMLATGGVYLRQNFIGAVLLHGRLR